MEGAQPNQRDCHFCLVLAGLLLAWLRLLEVAEQLEQLVAVLAALLLKRLGKPMKWLMNLVLAQKLQDLLLGLFLFLLPLIF